jgi:hypothetical protein
MNILDYFNKASNEDSTTVEILKNLCQRAGWKIKKIVGNGIVLGFETSIGLEHIHIQKCGKTDGDVIVEFSGDGFPLPEDAATAAMFSLMLMERNGEMLIAHWGIESIKDKKFFTVMHSAVAKTLDLEEFKAAVMGCLNEKERFIKHLNNS